MIGCSSNIFDGVQNPEDISKVCNSLVPPGGELFWSESAGAILKGVMSYCYINGNRTNHALWEALTAPADQIITMCAATPAGLAGHVVLADSSRKLRGAVLSVVAKHMAGVLQPQEGTA